MNFFCGLTKPRAREEPLDAALVWAVTYLLRRYLCVVESVTVQYPCLLAGGGCLSSVVIQHVTCLLQEQCLLSHWFLSPVREVEINFSGYITNLEQRFLINQVSLKLSIT